MAMSRSPALGLAAYKVESSFAEDLSTFDVRLAILNRIDLKGFKQPMLPGERTTPYRNQVTPGVQGVKRAEFTTKHYLTGHGSTCAGSITLNDIETLLGIALGRGSSDVASASSSGGTTAAAGGTSTSINVNQASGFGAGSIARAGTLGDGRGGGQPFVVGSHGTSIITLLTEIPAALNAADVVYSPAVINVPEGPTANGITSTRWLLQTANQQIIAYGCYPKQVVIEAKNGQVPTFEVTWGGAWWDFASEAFPYALSMQTHTPPVVAGGSCFINDVGTATRATLALRDFKLTYNLNVIEETGPGGLRSTQDIVGCVRGRDTITVELAIDSEAAGTNSLSDYFDGGPYHLLYGWSAVDGRAGGVYLPYLVPGGDRPTQEDLDGLNRSRLTLIGGTGNTTTSELTLSALRVFSG